MNFPFIVFEAKKQMFEQDNLIEKIIREFYVPHTDSSPKFLPKIFIYNSFRINKKRVKNKDIGLYDDKLEGYYRMFYKRGEMFVKIFSEIINTTLKKMNFDD